MTESDITTQNEQPTSLGTAAARNLASTTKSVPQMQEISSRWLLRMLPWVQVSGGVYRVNRRLSYTIGDGCIDFDTTGSQVRIIPEELRELPTLRAFEDPAALTALAQRFTQTEYEPGDRITETGQTADQLHLIAHGKIQKIGTGKYGGETVLATLADGDYFGETELLNPTTWNYTAKAATPATIMTITQQAFQEILAQNPALATHLQQTQDQPDQAQNTYGEAAIDMSAGHTGEPALPGTYVDYEASPREYELSVTQTVLRIHTRVADLYNQPMNQTEQQLRLTIEALKERQEHELINNPDFGLLHNADYKHRIQTRTGPPTPDDLDELLSCVWRDPDFIFAHPKTIAAFGRECSSRGIYPHTTEVLGNAIPAWRGIPIFPCNKIPITKAQTSSMLLMRTGVDSQGVIGLHQTGIPDEYQPSLSVRYMGIDEKAIISYLVSVYFSTAVLVPDALAVLENIQVTPPHEEQETE